MECKISAPISLTKLRWQCRRGMLELDMLLNRFLDQQYDLLTPAEKQVFEKLLSVEDPVLYDWLLGCGIPDAMDLQAMVEKIRIW